MDCVSPLLCSLWRACWCCSHCGGTYYVTNDQGTAATLAVHAKRVWLQVPSSFNDTAKSTHTPHTHTTPTTHTHTPPPHTPPPPPPHTPPPPPTPPPHPHPPPHTRKGRGGEEGGTLGAPDPAQKKTNTTPRSR